MDSLELATAESIYSVSEEIENFWCFFFQLLISMQMRARTRKRNKLFLHGCLVFFFKMWQLIVWFSSRDSGKTASLQPIGTSLCKAANTVKSIRKTSTLCSFFLFFTTRWRQFCWEYPQLCQFDLGAHKFGSIQHAIVCVCVKKSESSIFYTFQNEPKSWIHFGWTL